MRYESKIGPMPDIAAVDDVAYTTGMATQEQLAAIDALRREAAALRDLHSILWLMVGKALLDGAGRENFDHLMDGIADAMYT